MNNQTPQGTSNFQMMQYDAVKKSAGVAYALWFFFGLLGGHRFYLGKTGTAIFMLIIFLVSLPLTVVGVGFVGLAIVGIWSLVDAFCIPGWIRDHNLSLANTLR